MKTVVLDPVPVEVAELLERRKRLGLDIFDEIWEGTYHMAPAPRYGHARLDEEVAALLRPHARSVGLEGSGPFNVGEPDDFRVPDRGLHRGKVDPRAVFLPTAAMVVEILSPEDETYDKLPFYAAHGVDEVLVVNPDERRVHIFLLGGDGYEEAPASNLLGLTAGGLEAAIDWP